MSLINKMLQDLDARQAAGGGDLGLPNEVRPLPPHENRLPALLLAVLLVVLGIIFAARQWDWWPRDGATPAVLPIAPVTPSPPALVPAVPLPSLAPAIVPAPQPEVPPPVQENAGAQDASSMTPVSKEFLPLLDIEASLRLSDTLNASLEKKAERKSSIKAAAVNASPAPPVKPLPNEKRALPAAARGDAAARKSALAPAAPATNTSAVPSLIERTDALGSARERADAEYRKAIAAVNMGRMPEALDGLRNALKHDGQHSGSRQLLVRLLLEMKRPDEAIQALREGLQEQPAHLGWAMTLARLQVDRGDLAGAWQTLEHSLPVAGSSADFQGFAAHVLQRLGRSKDAVERYQAAVQLSPREGRWWLGLGLVLDAEGRSAEAKEAFVRARQCGNLSAELNSLLDQKLR
jgi:MSHA biogenesis protein MshN